MIFRHFIFIITIFFSSLNIFSQEGKGYFNIENIDITHFNEYKSFTFTTVHGYENENLVLSLGSGLQFYDKNVNVYLFPDIRFMTQRIGAFATLPIGTALIQKDNFFWGWDFGLSFYQNIQRHLNINIDIGYKTMMQPKGKEENINYFFIRTGVMFSSIPLFSKPNQDKFKRKSNFRLFKRRYSL
jgi:hypothetical protein